LIYPLLPAEEKTGYFFYDFNAKANYDIDSRNKIVDEIDKIVANHTDNNDLIQVSSTIFEIASTNRFFSKIYADLYSDLFIKYEFSYQNSY
jgi:hypothetical protein